MSLLDEIDDITGEPRPGRGLEVLRAHFKRCKEVLEGRIPPHAVLDEEAKEALWALRQHVAKLSGGNGLP
jgi:hypothetical protein